MKSLTSSLLILLTVLLAPISTAADYDQPYPENPFARDHVAMPAKETGSAPGQVQFTVLGALVSGDNSADDDLYFGGKLGTEKLLNEYGGVRFTVFQDVLETNGESLQHTFTSFRVGPSFHLLPYQRFDVGSYVEAGLTVVDMVDGKTGSKAPEVVLGGFMTFFVSSALFVRAELERAWCNVEVDGEMSEQDRTAALLGFGWAF